MPCRPTKIPGGIRRYALPPPNPGLLVRGNIDLFHRPFAENPDGSISTVRSASYDIDDGRRAVLIPTVVGKRVVSGRAAFHHYVQTGEHLGIFANWRMADRYSERLHVQQARIYCLD